MAVPPYQMDENKGPIAEAIANAAAPTKTEGYASPLSQDLSGNLRTVGSGIPPAEAAGTYIASSTTAVAAGGTPVTVFAAGVIVHGALIKNPNTATEPLFISAVGNAGTVEVGTTFALPIGQSVEFGPTVGSITANAATSAHPFAAVRW